MSVIRVLIVIRVVMNIRVMRVISVTSDMVIILMRITRVIKYIR
jgi:hypothetical protein